SERQPGQPADAMAGGAAIADLGAEAGEQAGNGQPDRRGHTPGGGRFDQTGGHVATSAKAGEEAGRDKCAGDQGDEKGQTPDDGLCRGQQLAENAGYAGNAAIAEPEHGSGKTNEAAAKGGGQGGEGFHQDTLMRIAGKVSPGAASKPALPRW